MKKIASIVIGLLCLIMCLVIPTAVLEKSNENNIVANAGFFDYGEYFFKLELEKLGFDLDKYPYNKEGDIELLTFQEKGFSEIVNVVDDYRVYFYIYNPQELAFDWDYIANGVRIGSKFNENEEPTITYGYQIECIKSAQNERFLKLGFAGGDGLLDESLHADINWDVREYDIISLRLREKETQKIHVFNINSKFYFTGYEKGYAEDVNAASTLESRRVDYEIYVEEEKEQITGENDGPTNIMGETTPPLNNNQKDWSFNAFKESLSNGDNIIVIVLLIVIIIVSLLIITLLSLMIYKLIKKNKNGKKPEQTEKTSE